MTCQSWGPEEQGANKIIENIQWQIDQTTEIDRAIPLFGSYPRN